MEQLKIAVESLKNNKPLVQKIETGTLLVTTPNAIVLRTVKEGEREAGNVVENILAAMINGAIIGNSDRMFNAKSRDVTQEFQRPLSDLIPMIPFGAIKRTGLSLKNYVEVDRGPEETVYINNFANWVTPEQFEAKFSMRHNAVYDKEHNRATWQDARHFTGARLFVVEKDYFLMDIDRGEIIHGIFNPFLVKLTNRADTIQEAYEQLKPQAVQVAENAGLDVKRQGEWFFVPCRPEDVPMAKPESMALRAGQNRPNWVDEGFVSGGVSYVRGTISHSGREHKDIKLETWHIAVPNTSVGSWQLSGDID